MNGSARLQTFLVFVAALFGCGRARNLDSSPDASASITVETEAPVAIAASSEAVLVMTRFECARCHDGAPSAPVADNKHCVHCHRQIIAGRFEAPAKDLARWQSHLVSLRQAPSLGGIGRLYRRDWLREYLLHPHDLRPALPATMPRLTLSNADAAVVAAHLVPDEANDPDPFTAEERVRGAALYATYACASCHSFTGAQNRGQLAPPSQSQPADALALAPDLAVTRQRFQRGALVPWLLEPRQLKPDALMPRFPMSAPEARALAAFILLEPLRAPAAPVVPARLPVLKRRVGFDEVSRRVFRKICWHCHSQPDYALGDGGPGNSGGFGFAPRGLDLSSAVGAAAGALDDDGRRRSIFRDSAGMPELVARLVRRQEEELGRVIPDQRGMPLGLPALSPQEIQLVESWVAQGRPR